MQAINITLDGLEETVTALVREEIQRLKVEAEQELLDIDGCVAYTGWTKQTIRDFAKAAYKKIKTKISHRAVLVAALWIHSDGCYIVSKLRGDDIVNFMYNNRLTALAWNSYNELQTNLNLEDRFHVENSACFYVES